MRDIESLSAQVTLREYETGRDLFSELRERGIPTNKAVGMIYRAGCIDGKRAAKDRSGRDIARLHEVIRELKSNLTEADASTIDLTDSDTEGETLTDERSISHVNND